VQSADWLIIGHVEIFPGLGKVIPRQSKGKGKRVDREGKREREDDEDGEDEIEGGEGIEELEEERGDFIITFHVRFPWSLGAEEKRMLKEIL